MIDPNAKADLNKLITYGWASEDEVADIGRGLRKYIADLDERLGRLDKVEEILNKLEEGENAEVLKHFEVLKSA